MVWIHGGSFTGGSGKIYDGRWLVSRDIIVVTINYRLGTLGFLADPSLGPPGDVGNYGLQDQQAALRWVQGQHRRVRRRSRRRSPSPGESAGGMSVCDHLVAPGSKGLFRAAIIQSAPCGAQADLPTANGAASSTRPRRDAPTRRRRPIACGRCRSTNCESR